MATRNGLEPSTSSVTAFCGLDYYIKYNSRCKDFNGRGRRIRTLGTRFWRPLLYQLSYTPISLSGDSRQAIDHFGGPSGIRTRDRPVMSQLL